MDLKTAREAPTIRELLAERGFFVDTSKFEGILLSAGASELVTCDPLECSHAPGPSQMTSVMDAMLDRTGIASSCSFLQNPTLMMLKRLCASVLEVHTDPAYLLNIRVLGWWDGWYRLLLPHASGLSLKDANNQWIREKVAANKDMLYELFLESLELEYGVPLPPAVSGVSEPFVLVQPFEGGLFAEGQVLCEEYFGPSGFPGVLSVPARLLHPLPFKELSYQASRNWSVLREESYFEPEGVVWFFGENACTRPVEVLDSYTPAILETAAVLMESMSLEDALSAAAEV